ncbi:MAG: fascin domain-containing protein, partial [Opitutaceae bacterium]
LPNLVHGFYIGLQSVNGQWLCAENGGGGTVVANRTGMGSWERFEVVVLGDALFESGVEVGLRTADGFFLCAEGGGGSTLVANRMGMGEWETFRIHRLAGPGLISTGDAVSLQSVEQGNYWCAVNGGGGIVDVTRTGVGSWETFTITVDAETDKSSESVWIDINGDGIRDEVVKIGAQGFDVGIAGWYTECYDYDWYPVNDVFLELNRQWGTSWPETPGFSLIWEPDNFWMFASSYSYCETSVEPALVFHTTAGQRYRVFQDTSGSGTSNPSSWDLILSSDSFGHGMQTISLGYYNADDLYLGQFFLVRLGGPPVGVAPENDYTWRWEEIPGYPAGRTWDGVTIHADFPQWNWQNWPNDWWMTGPDDDDPALEPLFGAGFTARAIFESAADSVATQREQYQRRTRRLPRSAPVSTPWTIVINLLLMGVYVLQEIEEKKSNAQWSYVVYEKLQPGSNHVYTGRTHGIGDPSAVLARRDARHWALAAAGYQNAQANAIIETQGKSAYAYGAFSGREQQIMDYHGGALSGRNYDIDTPGPNGRTRASNIRRAVGKDRPEGYSYWLTSNQAFGASYYGFSGDPSLEAGAPLIVDSPILFPIISSHPMFFPN